MIARLREIALRVCGWLLLFNLIYQIIHKFAK